MLAGSGIKKYLGGSGICLISTGGMRDSFNVNGAQEDEKKEIAAYGVARKSANLTTPDQTKPSAWVGLS